MDVQASPKKSPFRRVVTGSIAITAVFGSLWYVLQGFAWQEVGNLLAGIDLGSFVVGVLALNIPYWHLRALRWWLLLKRCGERTSYAELHMATIVGVAIAPFTPGQVGEALKIELLRKSGATGRQAGYGTFLVERALDLGFLLTLGMVGVAAGTFPQLAHLSWLLWVGLGGLLIGAILLWRLPLKGKLGAAQANMRKSLNHGSTNLAVLILSALGWVVVAFGWQLILKSIGLSMSMLDLFGFMATSTAMLILSFVPAGIGVWEAGGSLLLEATGVPAAKAQAGALVLRLFTVSTLLLAGSRWLWWRCRTREKEVE